MSQPVFQVLGPQYSETWFDLKSRTTATMIIAVGETPPCLTSYFLNRWIKPTLSAELLASCLVP